MSRKVTSVLACAVRLPSVLSQKPDDPRLTAKDSPGKKRKSPSSMTSSARAGQRGSAPAGPSYVALRAASLSHTRNSNRTSLDPVNPSRYQL